MPRARHHQCTNRHHHFSLLMQITAALLLTFISFIAQTQPAIESRLIHNCRVANSDSDRIIEMGRLSDYYYANKDFTSGDSLIEKQIMLAEASLNQRLILLAYFGNAGYRFAGTSTKGHFQNTADYITRALEYAKSHELTDYVAMAYANLAGLYISDGRHQEAFKNASLGFTTALNTNNDSTKIVCAVQLGDIHLNTSDVLTAFKTYSNAYNIAIGSNKELLLSPVLQAIANLYKKLDKREVAKSYLFRSLALNKKGNNIDGQINDNILLAKVSNYTAAKDYLLEAVRLADSTGDVRQKIEAEKILFSYMLLKESSAHMLNYLEKQPELKNVFLNTGPDYINWILAEIFLFAGQPDSALTYFTKAENSFNTGYDLVSKKNFFGEMAYCLEKLGKVTEAINCYKKTVELAKAATDLNGLKNYTYALKNLYQLEKNYEQAFHFSVLYDNYKDSVDLLSKEKDLALLEIENEAKMQQRETELAESKLRRKYNLQYMLITIVVATAFVLLIMIGMFKVSTFTIRLMGFLSLIFLFEFIILVLDTWIHSITHGEPWKSWLIKIGIISFLLPVHHFLEHKLIRYLLSRHLIYVRSRISFNALFRHKKKLPPKKEVREEKEESTATP